MLLDLKIPAWHSLYYTQSNKGVHLIYSAVDSSLAPHVFSEESYVTLLAQIEENNQEFLQKLDYIKQELKTQDTLLVYLELFQHEFVACRVVGLTAVDMLISEGPMKQMELPLDDIRNIIIPENGETIDQYFSHYPFSRDRLFFSHTALRLKKGEIQYHNVLVVGQKVHIGISDHVSVSLGSDPFTRFTGLFDNLTNSPLYGSISVGGKLGKSNWHVAGGAQFLAFGEFFRTMGLSLVATKGTPNSNLTIRVYAIQNINFNLGQTGGMMIGFNHKVSKHWHLTSENMLNLQYIEQEFPSEPVLMRRVANDWRMINCLGVKHIKNRHSVEVGVLFSGSIVSLTSHFRMPSTPSERIVSKRNNLLLPFFTYAYWLKPKVGD